MRCDWPGVLRGEARSIAGHPKDPHCCPLGHRNLQQAFVEELGTENWVSNLISGAHSEMAEVTYTYYMLNVIK